MLLQVNVNIYKSISIFFVFFVHKYTGIFQSLVSPSVVMDWLNKGNSVTVDTVTSAKMNAVTMQTNQKIKNAS